VAAVKEVATKLGTLQKDCGLKEPVLQFVEQFRFGLVEVVYEWAKGKVHYVAI
jgi:antiviral helicase SKI2